jgi:hypothetical protein
MPEGKSMEESVVTYIAGIATANATVLAVGG